MSRILVVDDKELMRDSVATMLTRAGWTVQVAPNGKAAMAIAIDKKPDVILTDLQMPQMTGIELLREVRRIDEQMPVVLMTAFATVETAVEAMKLGAYDYITKPFNGNQLIATVKRAFEHAHLIRENAILQTQVEHQNHEQPKANGSRKRTGTQRTSQLVGDSPVMQALKSQIRRIAPSQSTVLICGESGVGKEVVANTIHQMSSRTDASMLAVNCAALNASLLESELFGHERGAFTGADKLRKGRFELAEGSTLLLDEISEVPSSIQAKLLRVLQERLFERVGSSVSQKTDARIIATTNRDLTHEVLNGRFRQDLFYRLNVLPIVVPPLRDRLEDLPLLANHFLEKIAHQEGNDPRHFDDDAIRMLQAYHWPGNIRELANICERASLFSESNVIHAHVVRNWLLAGGQARPMHTAQTHSRANVLVEPRGLAENPATLADSAIMGYGPVSNPMSNDTSHLHSPVSELERLSASQDARSQPHFQSTPIEEESIAVIPGKSLEEVEREVIIATLQRNDGHRQKTAKDLGIAVRTLGLKLRKWKDLHLVAEDL